MKDIVKWYLDLTDTLKIIISSIFSAIPIYFSAFLSSWIGEVLKVENEFVFILHIVFVVILLAVIIFISSYFYNIKKMLEGEDELFKDNMLLSYTVCDRGISRKIKKINTSKNNGYSYAISVMGSIENIQDIINSLYTFLESQYSRIFANDERVNFEVTFMTMSYADKKLTIPASANRHGRAPHSMLLREKNIDIYSDTVTASIYRRGLAEPVVVEDTEDSHNKYSELYAGQKRRIKSSIIYPVLSDSNQILGTIVAHCDQKLFFKEKDVKKWIEMLEIYSKKIALEKVKLDVLYDSFSGALDIKINNSPPF